MTQGGWGQPGDRYDDQYRDSFPQPPAAPWTGGGPGGPGDDGGQATEARPAPQPYAQPGGYAHPGQAGGYDPQWSAGPGEDATRQAPAYGQQYRQAPAYQQQPYQQQTPWGTPPPGWGAGPDVRYASWGARAGALLLDGLFTLLIYAPGLALAIAAGWNAETDDEVNGGLLAAGGLLLVVGFAVQVWNQGWRQGSTGWSWGKQVVGIKLVRATDAQVPGGWVGIGRMLLRTVLGNVTFGVYTLLTYLWPLWDDRNQTLDDKMLNTLVVRVR